MRRKDRIVWNGLIGIIISAMICGVIPTNSLDAFANEKETTGSDYVISVPEETRDYVIMTSDDINADAVVENEEGSIYVSDDSNVAAGEDTIVEENIEFEASIESTEMIWVTKEAAEDIKENHNTEWNYDMINVEPVDPSESNGGDINNGTKIAVLDSGVDYIADTDLYEAVNFVETEQDIENMLCDMTGHGTSVAGIISKIDPEAMIYSVKVLDEDNKGTLSRIVQGIYWCIDNDIDIINMSFGTAVRSEILEKAIEDAKEHGILMISAAGNDHTKEVEYPARFDNVVAVGSAKPNGEISDNSACSDDVEVLAPGEAVFTQSMLGAYTVVNGTSIATPHVTGAASLLWKQDKDKSAEFISGLMCESANKTIESDGDAGLLDVEYAIDSYDTYQGGSNNEISENQNEVTACEESDFFASWGSDGGGHETCASYGINNPTESSVFTDLDIKAIKKGAVYNDRALLSHEYGHGRRSTNWIASYKYLTALAKKFRTAYTASDLNKPTGQEVFGSGKFTSMIAVAKADFSFNYLFYNKHNDEPDKDEKPNDWEAWHDTGLDADHRKPWSDDLVLGECDYELLLQHDEVETIAKLKSMFIYGVALHTLTDAFAHAAYADRDPGTKIVHSHDVKTAAQKAKLKPYDTDADTINDYPWRFKDAKFASGDIMVHASTGTCGKISDFWPNDYRVNKKAGSRGYFLHKIVDKACAIDEEHKSKHKAAFGAIDFKSENNK